MNEKIILLRLDGEIWECVPGWDTDENSVSNVRAIPKDSALNKGQRPQQR